jgi:hypothetical protein
LVVVEDASSDGSVAGDIDEGDGDAEEDACARVAGFVRGDLVRGHDNRPPVGRFALIAFELGGLEREELGGFYTAAGDFGCAAAGETVGERALLGGFVLEVDVER